MSSLGQSSIGQKLTKSSQLIFIFLLFINNINLFASVR